MTFHHPARSLVTLLILAVSLGGGAAAAQGTDALTLAAALAGGSEYAADVVTARTNLTTAERDHAVAAADPSTTPMALAAAQRAVDAAADALAVATATAEGDAAAAYAAVLEAATTRDLAARQLDILTRTLEATRARFGAGAVTAADVAKAETDVASQRRTLDEAETSLAFAQDSLAVLLGAGLGSDLTALTPVTEADLLADEPLEDVTDRAGEASARVRSAQRSLQAAQEQLGAVDNALSSRSDIDAARTAVTTASDALADMQATVVRDVQRAYASVTAARNRYRGTLDSVDSAAADLAAQQVRLTAGTISELAYAQSELSAENARASAASALHALLSAQYALRLASLR